jgi:hypothetical protein
MGKEPGEGEPMNLKGPRWYKDRNFPEIKSSNAHVIAVVENRVELDKIVAEHNLVCDEKDAYIQLLTERVAEEKRNHCESMEILAQALSVADCFCGNGRMCSRCEALDKVKVRGDWPLDEDKLESTCGCGDIFDSASELAEHRAMVHDEPGKT